MTKQRHLNLHQYLHQQLDKIVADYIMHTKKILSNTTVEELMDWSYTQTKAETIIHFEPKKGGE